MTTYSELLRHPFWQIKRLRILERDGVKCTICSDSLSNLQVHHHYYLPDALPWEYPDEALTTLCELCHEKTEFNKWLCSEGLKNLKKDGYERSDLKEIINLTRERLFHNHHKASAREYMRSIKTLCNG